MTGKPLTHDHPRVIRCSPGMTATERKALWPHGVSVAQVEVMERQGKLAPYRGGPATLLTAPPKDSPPVGTGFNRAPGGAVRGGGGGGIPAAVQTRTVTPAPAVSTKPVNPLAEAAANVVAAFNRKFSE